MGSKWIKLGIDFRLQSLYNLLIKQMSKDVDISVYLKYDRNMGTYIRIAKRRYNNDRQRKGINKYDPRNR